MRKKWASSYRKASIWVMDSQQSASIAETIGKKLSFSYDEAFEFAMLFLPVFGLEHEYVLVSLCLWPHTVDSRSYKEAAEIFHWTEMFLPLY